MKLRPAPLALGLLFAAGTAGCSGSAPTACPALAWFNSLSVTLDGNSQLVSLVEFCAEDVCSVRSDGPVRLPVTSLSPGVLPGPASTLPLTPASASSAPPASPYTTSRVDDRTWHVSLMMRAPTTVTIKAYAAGGGVLARREVQLDWTRVGGNEACGGPVTAGPVRLTI